MPFNFKYLFKLFVLIVFSYQAIGSYLTFFAWKLYTLEQVETLATSLPNESLIKITQKYTGTTLHELEENFVMYDVVRYQINGNSIDYFCIDDPTETHIKNTFYGNSAFENVKHKTQETAKNILKKITEKQLVFFQHIQTISLPIYGLLYAKHSHLKLYFYKIAENTPPPEI